MRSVGEIFVRSMTNPVHPEKIAEDLSGIAWSRSTSADQFPTAWSQFPGGLFMAIRSGPMKSPAAIERAR